MASEKFGFISYSSKDKKFAEKLANDLNQNGLPIFFDKWEIKVGDSIVEKIDLALGKMTDLIIILSNVSIMSNWVKKELSSALVKKLKNKSVRILPVLKEKCKIPSIIEDLKYANFTEAYETGFVDLIDTLNLQRTNLPTPKKNPEIEFLENVFSSPLYRYKPVRRSELPAINNVQLIANVLLDIAGISSGRETLYCGNCKAGIFLNKDEPKPLVCTNCGQAINWIGIRTKLIKECPLCKLTFPSHQNFCALHYPAVALLEKEVEMD